MSEDGEAREGIPGWDYAAPLEYSAGGFVALCCGQSLFIEGRDGPIYVATTGNYTEADLAALIAKDQREHPERWQITPSPSPVP